MIVMEVVEEENPLGIYNEATNNLPTNIKNSVGRPRKKSEIKFSPQPKSIISILLSKEKRSTENHENYKNKINNRTVRNDSTTEDYSKREQNDQNVCSKQKIQFQTDKLYECNFLNCTYSTKFPSNLKTHKRIHTPEHQYICDKCTFRSKFVSSLKTHKRLHSDERPYGCKYCAYKCNSHSNLKKHISRKHIEIKNNN